MLQGKESKINIQIICYTFLMSDSYESEYQRAMKEERDRSREGIWDRGDEGVWDTGEDYEAKEQSNPLIDSLFDSYEDLRASLIVRAPEKIPHKDNIEYSFKSADKTIQAALWDDEEDSDKTRMEIMAFDEKKVTAVFFEGKNVGIQKATLEEIKKRKVKPVSPEILSDEELKLAHETIKNALEKLYFNE